MLSSKISGSNLLNQIKDEIFIPKELYLEFKDIVRLLPIYKSDKNLFKIKNLILL